MVATSQEAAANPLSPPLNVDEHIAKLKEAARNTSPDGTTRAGVYLPPVEVARSIPCRYFPNCSRADCIFYHPVPATAASSEASNGAASNGAPGVFPITADLGVTGNGQHEAQQNGALNGYSSAGNGNGNGATYDVNAAMQQQAEQQMHMSQMYYSQGYDPNAEYMQHYQNPYMAAHQQQQAAYYGYPQYQPQNQQMGYQPYPNPYYAQQGMYASVPPMAYAPPQGPQYDASYPQQQQNGHMQAQADPAIISQGNKRTSPSHPSAMTSPSAPVASQTMAKSASSGSNKSSKSAKKAAAAASADSANASVNTPVVQEPASTSVPSLDTQQAPSVSSPPTGAMSPSSAAQPLSPPHAAGISAEQHQHMYGDLATSQQNGHSPANSQAQLEADFAKASLNGTQPQQNGDASKKHERSSSAQMRTLYQTGGDSTSTAIPQSPYHTPVPTNSLSASTARPIHTGPRLHESQNQGPISSTGYAGHRRELSNSMNGIPTGPAAGKRPFSGPGGLGPRPVGAPHRGPFRPFDSRGPLPACKYFADGNCRFGDNCHFVHQLNHSLPLLNDPEGKMTSDAKLLKQNIGNPDGGIATLQARTSKERPQGGNYGYNGTMVQPGAAMNNGRAPARFAQANGFHAPAPEKKEGQALNGNPEEQFQKLISEMPRPASQTVQPAAKLSQAASSVSQQQSQPPVRSNPIPPTLGQRPHGTPAHKQAGPFSHNNRSNHGQRVPNGENDFPALLGTTNGSNGMERTASGSSSSGPAPTSATDSKPAEQSSEASAVDAAPTAVPAAEKKEEDIQSTATPSSNTAPAKPAFSWASAAAKAASLPDPPKRSASKARSAPAAKEAEPSATAPAASAAPAAVQTLNAEATTAPAVKA